MDKLLPFRKESTRDSGEPELVEISDDAADEVLSALSSDTARAILSHLYEDPATASDLAEVVDTSLQNTRYHLERLESADVIEPVDTWYSSRGNEMTVYAPTGDPLIVTAGSEESTSRLRKLLYRLIGSVTLLTLASVTVDRLLRWSGGSLIDDGGTPGVPSTEPPRDTSTAAPSATGREPPPDTATATPTTQNTTPSPTPEGMQSNGTLQPSPTNTSTEGSAITETLPPTPTPTPNSVSSPETITDTMSSLTITPVSGDPEVASVIPQGPVFFVGMIAVVVIAAIWWYRTGCRSINSVVHSGPS